MSECIRALNFGRLTEFSFCNELTRSWFVILPTSDDNVTRSYSSIMKNVTKIKGY